MPRAERHSFPIVHSLYLSREQDARLRRLARRSGKTLSETLRSALEAFFAAQGVAGGNTDAERPEPTRSQTREKIAEAARKRKRERGPRNAPVWPGQHVAGGTVIWQPPPHFAAPGDDGELELARDRDGLPARALLHAHLFKRLGDDVAHVLVLLGRCDPRRPDDRRGQRKRDFALLHRGPAARRDKPRA